MPEIANDSDSFYNAAWEKWNDMIRYSPAPRLRRTRLLSWIKKKSGCKTLLDVGCGNGEFLLQARKELHGLAFSGADVSSAVIEANRASLPEITFTTLDLNRENLDRMHDVVTCMEVIEHCNDYREAISRLAAMTNNWLYLTVPCGPLFEIDHRVGHLRHFSPAEIHEALTSAGLTVTRLEAWGFPFFNIYKYLINMNPDKSCNAFLSNKAYSFSQKLLATLVYFSFKLCIPSRGFQLFAEAKRS